MEPRESRGRAGERIEEPGEDGNATGRPTESTNLNSGGSQKMNHQPKSIHGLDLGPLAHMEQMCSLVFNWNGCYPKSCCLSVGYILLAGLSCLASVGEDAPSPAKT